MEQSVCITSLVSEFVLTSQNVASVSWGPLQHADHVFVVVANSKAWLIPALICCLTIIRLSGRLWAHTAFTILSSRLLQNYTLQERKKRSDMFTAFSKTLTAGSLIAECGGAQKWKWTTRGENCSSSPSVCVWYVNLQPCSAACFPCLYIWGQWMVPIDAALSFKSP